MKVHATELARALTDGTYEVTPAGNDFHVHRAPTRIRDAVRRGQERALETVTEFLRGDPDLARSLTERVPGLTPGQALDVLTYLAAVLEAPETAP